MSFGDPQIEGAYGRDRIARLTAEADAINAGRQAGHKTLLGRLLNRLRRRATATPDNPMATKTYGPPPG
jgi:hypothetical protein